MIINYDEAINDWDTTVTKVADHINRPISKAIIQIISDYLKYEVILEY